MRGRIHCSGDRTSVGIADCPEDIVGKIEAMGYIVHHFRTGIVIDGGRTYNENVAILQKLGISEIDKIEL